MSDDGHGKAHGRFTIPTRYAAQLDKILRAIAAPKHQSATHGKGAAAAGLQKPGPERMGSAFCELIDSLQAKDLPKSAGTGATAVVIMGLETLLGGLKPAILDTGQPISAAQARMMACQAGLIPAVLGRESQLLDLGREARLFSKEQRIALGIRDGGCTAEGCDWPPGRCHAHHDIRWVDGGLTDIKHGRLLCPSHHARVHDSNYTIIHRDNGKIGFSRRQ